MNQYITTNNLGNQNSRKKNSEKYYQRHKERLKQNSKKYYTKNKENINKKKRDRYNNDIEFRRKINNQSREYVKRTGYAKEKTPKQRKLRYIKSRTRILYSLEGEFCKYCNKPAEHRHHNTKPIEIDKFKFVCKECHKKLHKKDYNKLKTRSFYQCLKLPAKQPQHLNTN